MSDNLKKVEEKGFRYLRIISSPNDPDVKMLTWAFKYVYSSGIYNMIWSIENEKQCIGTVGFVEMIKNGG